MDPKLSNLDPKLQDAYNRVMNGPASPPQPQADASPIPPPPTDAGLNPPPPAAYEPTAGEGMTKPQSSLNDTLNDSMGTNQPPPPTEPIPDASTPTPDPSLNSIAPGSEPEPSAPPFSTEPSSAPQGAAPLPDPTMPPSPYPSQPTSMPDAQIVPPPAQPTQVANAPLEQGTIPNQPQSTLPAGAIPGVTTTVAFNASDSQKNVGTTPVKKGGSVLMPVFIGIGIVLLLVAYTFVWIIIFNVQVPFLPQL